MFIQAISQKRITWLENAFLVGLASMCLAVANPIAIKLPFTPVPIVLAVNLSLAVGMVLGSKRGALAVFFFILQGLLGLPVFALGASGPLYLAGPVGGYLLGYLAGAYVTGYVTERARERTAFKNFLILTIGNSVVYLCGAMQLSLFIGLKSALLLGVCPFIITDVLKNLILSKIIASASNR